MIFFLIRIKLLRKALQIFLIWLIKYTDLNRKSLFVGNKAKRRISKRVLQENKARQILRKTNVLAPNTYTFLLPYYRRLELHDLKCTKYIVTHITATIRSMVNNNINYSLKKKYYFEKLLIKGHWFFQYHEKMVLNWPLSLMFI